MYITYIENKPGLHLDDVATNFRVAKLLRILAQLFHGQCLLNAGPLCTRKFPAVASSTEDLVLATTFLSIASSSNIEANRTEIEGHSSLGVDSRYHQPLRDTFRKIMIGFSKV